MEPPNYVSIRERNIASTATTISSSDADCQSCDLPHCPAPPSPVDLVPTPRRGTALNRTRPWSIRILIARTLGGSGVIFGHFFWVHESDTSRQQLVLYGTQNDIIPITDVDRP